MKKIIIEGGKNSTFNFLDSLKDGLDQEGWQRDRKKERELMGRNHAAGYYATLEYCIIYPYFPKARIYFVLSEQGDTYISHIESMEKTRLTTEKRDQIVQDFYDLIVREAQRETGVSVVLSE